MRLDVVTIFPEYLEPLNVSLVGKARARGQLNVQVHDLREWTYDRHNTVDDTPYGGGPGMVMKTDPWGDALDSVLAEGYESGAGVKISQGRSESSTASSWVKGRPLGVGTTRTGPWEPVS